MSSKQDDGIENSEIHDREGLTRQESMSRLGHKAPYRRSGNVSRELAELCELMGGCEPGVEWGKSHHISEIADPSRGFETSWCVWIIDHLGSTLDPKLRELFLNRVIAERPTRARMWWEKLDYLTHEEYDRLFNAAKVNQDWKRSVERGQVQRGDLSRQESRDG